MKKERIYVTEKDIIRAFEGNLVTLTLRDGRTFERLEPRRLFPVKSPDSYIALLGEDGIEVAQIKKLTDLNDASMASVVESLETYYLVPVILKIIASSERYGTLRWTVETDRGMKTFDIRNRNHDIKVYSDGRVRVRDADDNRYVIKDYRALDAYSRALLIAEI